jgi:signal transduction histidine kinase
MRTYSIARRLIAMVLLIELTAALCVTAAAYFYERHTHFHAFEIMLRGRADSLLGAVQDAEDSQDNVMLDGSEVTLPAEDLYDVRDASGRVLGHSANWTEKLGASGSRSISIEQLAFNHDNFTSVREDGRTYRMIRLQGLRVVDPGDKGGGIHRQVTIYYGSPIRPVWSAILQSVGFYALTSLLVLAVTGVLMSWLLNRGLAPLRGLARSASEVSVSAWSFLPSEDVRRTEELVPLVTALESVLHGLEQSFEQQQRFVGDAAHELKTSVAVVKSSLQLLVMKPRTAPEYEIGLERCLADCARMEAIVAQMLMLARMEQSTSVCSGARMTGVFDAICEIVDQLKTTAETRGIVFQVRSDPFLFAKVDPEQFKLLCLNLLMNAIQHSAPATAISVDTFENKGQCEVRIVDHGDGIDPDHIPRLFERFSRSDPSRSRGTGGTGLGLAICKAIVDKNEGNIEIVSALDEGTTVVVHFPLADAMLPAGDTL